MPAFNIEGHCAGTEQLGIYEELEQMAGLAPACQLTALPFEQMTKFLTIASALGRVPVLLLYLEAYRLTTAHVRARIEAAQTPGQDVFSVFELLVVRNEAIDHAILRPQLDALVTRFRDHYGEQFPNAVGAAVS
jgi:hypothetical protein